MGRNRFVQPDIVRIYLVDVHRRALQDLQDPIKRAALDPDKRATPADIAREQARLADAESDGAWIEIKKELNAGESRHVFGRLIKDMRAGEKITLEPELVGLTKVVEYLVGWSFTDSADHSVDVSEGAINSLDQDTYTELVRAIDLHEERLEAERTARKNVTAGTLPSAAISA